SKQKSSSSDGSQTASYATDGLVKVAKHLFTKEEVGSVRLHSPLVGNNGLTLQEWWESLLLVEPPIAGLAHAELYEKGLTQTNRYTTLWKKYYRI
ncbi:hypothetical protein DM01DRAFT_1405829, partial [Hesseltinella vesiculosa]